VDGGPDIGQDEVAGTGRPRHHVQLGEPFAQVVDVLVDLPFGWLGVGRVDLDAVVALRVERQTGTNLDRRGEPERPVHLDVVLGEVELRVGDGGEVMFAQRPHVVGGEELFDELVEDDVASHARVDDLLRHVALAEAGDLDLPGDLAVGAVEVLGELLWWNLHLKANRVLGGLLDGRLHRCSRAYRNFAKRLRRRSNA
jgi:hypothetical protein